MKSRAYSSVWSSLIGSSNSERMLRTACAFTLTIAELLHRVIHAFICLRAGVSPLDKASRKGRSARSTRSSSLLSFMTTERPINVLTVIAVLLNELA